MTTATKAPKSHRPCRKQQQPRTARLLDLGDSCPALVLTAGRDVTAYLLRALPSAAGHAFRLEKADQGDGPGEVYDVLINGARGSCECKGFLRWGHCKHLEALAALLAAGKLSAGPGAAGAAAPQCNDFDDP